MTPLVKALGDVCRNNKIDEKVLLAPSLRIGHQWLECVALAGTPTFNVHVKTMKSFVLEVAAPELAATNVTQISSSGSEIVIERIWTRIRPQLQYFTNAQPSRRFFRMICRTIEELRLTGTEPQGIKPSAFEATAKCPDLQLILRTWIECLKENNWTDYAWVLGAAEKCLREKAATNKQLLLIPHDLNLQPRERRLLNQIPEAQRIELPVDRGHSATPTDAELLTWNFDDGNPPQPRNDGTATIVSAVGEINEVREVLRRCVANGRQLDQVEVVCATFSKYAPLFYETLHRSVPPDESGRVVPQVTFAEGIPIRYSRPARALRAWIQWRHAGYPQEILARMLHDGLLEVPERDDEISFAYLARQLRLLGVGFGRDRYQERLQRHMDDVSQQITAGRPCDTDESGAKELSSLERKHKGLGFLRNLLIPLLAIDEKPPIEAARSFLETLVRYGTDLDRGARNALIEALNERILWTQTAPGAGTTDDEWLTDLIDELFVLASGPQPGHLHVSSLYSGGHSGRPHTFIVGLNDGNFPGPCLQDPLMLDDERRRISGELPTAVQQLERRIADFRSLLVRVCGSVCLSFACRDIKENRETFPSSVILNSFRLLSGQRDGDFAALTRWLGRPVSFGPDVAAKALDDGDWWLWRLDQPERVVDAIGVVERSFTHLASGRGALQQRQSNVFTAYDGRLSKPSADLNPFAPDGPVMSSTRLELLGTCPLKYFYRYVLGLEPPERLPDEDKWLRANEYGSLMHEVFYRFMLECTQQHRAPNNKDLARLLQLLQEEVARQAQEFPPLSPIAYNVQVDELKRTMQLFLLAVEQQCRQALPAHLEASIGMPSQRTATEIDSLEPLSIKLSGAQKIRARGRIDRIDRRTEGKGDSHNILDYKSGSTWKYDEKPPFYQGRVLQHVLYVQLVEQAIRRVRPSATVAEFRYFFPGTSGEGESRSYEPTNLNAGLETIRHLCQLVSQGSFPPTTDEKDCKFCDYHRVCGNVRSVTKSCGDKLINPENDGLQSFREVRK